MAIARALTSIATLALCAGLVACSGGVVPPSGAEPTTATSSTSPTPEATSGGETPTEPGAGGAEPPVAKVERAGHTTDPTITADPAGTGSAVTYDDGVKVRIDDVTFGAETAQGPGSFPDREYARLTITITNGSSDKIDLGTSVLTLLDADGTAAVRVYAAEAEAVDFAGVLAAGKSATASYAFAVPADARDDVTLVVDFDGDHSSAVFQGGLD